MLYHFAECTIDLRQRWLRRGGEIVALEPLVFDLLEFLIRNRDRVVSKDALIASVWSGRIVSDSTLNSRISAARQAIGDSGRDQRLIRTVSRRGFQFIAKVRDAAARAAAAAELHPPPAILSGIKIAVLPFASLSATHNDSFVRGLVEEITSALAQFPWLSVVARSSSAVMDDWTVDIRQIGQCFSVRYALEGSVRRFKERVRVLARLIDVTTNTSIWAGRFDVPHDDVFDIQDEIGSRVGGAIAARLERVAIAQVHRHPGWIGSEAIEAYLRGIGQMYQWSREGFDKALRHFDDAATIEPDFASAYAMAAYCYLQRKSYGWLHDGAADAKECARLGLRAAELGRNDAMVLARAAHTTASVGRDIDGGMVMIERALALNPGLAGGWYVSGWLNLFLGRNQLAIEQLARAMKLGLYETLSFKIQGALAYGLFFVKDYDAALVAAAAALQARPNYMTAMRITAASQALLGRERQAHTLAERILELDPNVRISNLAGLIPFRHPDNAGKWSDALRLAGVPE